MKSEPVVPILFRSLLAAGCLAGIILTVARTGNPLQTFSYYTLQSNAVCLLLFASLSGRDLIRTGSRRLTREAGTLQDGAKSPSGTPGVRGWLHVFKGGCTLYILITFLVYHFLLNPQLGTIAPGYQAFSLSDALVHYVTPLMVLLDYLLFDRKGLFRARHPLYWALLPLSYLLYVFVYVSLGGRFGSSARPSRAPYFFLDIDRLGVTSVAQWVLIIVALFLILAYALVLLDHWLGRRTRRVPDGPGRQPPAPA